MSVTRAAQIVAQGHSHITPKKDRCGLAAPWAINEVVVNLWLKRHLISLLQIRGGERVSPLAPDISPRGSTLSPNVYLDFTLDPYATTGYPVLLSKAPPANGLPGF
jgi:hypothetical protein